MKRLSKILLASVTIGLLSLAFGKGQEIFIESQESKTLLGGPVFNKIQWFHFPDKDVWMMNQSHHGSSAPANTWDRLAIVVDTSSSPKIARFYQLEPGPLEWRDDLPQKPFRVSCFLCHNNGPRALRPNHDSPFDPTSWGDRLRVSFWNLRIKLYGRVQEAPELNDQAPHGGAPFRFGGIYENEPLSVATCQNCHKESGFLARGLLRRQQTQTMRFMVGTGQMPPPGFFLSSKEKLQLERFLQGG